MVKVLLCDGHLYQGDDNTSSVGRTKGLVNRCLAQTYELHSTLLLLPYIDQNFFFLFDTGSVAPKWPRTLGTLAGITGVNQHTHLFILTFFLHIPGP